MTDQNDREAQADYVRLNAGEHPSHYVFRDFLSEARMRRPDPPPSKLECFEGGYDKGVAAARAQQSAGPLPWALSESERPPPDGTWAARELRRLNPYARQDAETKRPEDALGRFLFALRYYAGMLEDDDNWSHSLGHIQECCAEFQKAIDARAGKVTR